MSFEDKLKATGENLEGKAKEAYGKVSGNKDTQAEGKMEQVGAEVKEKAAELSDKAKEVAENVGSNIKAAAEKIKEGFSDN
ncbi:MAG: CsbD family protein [Actinomycetaceae bacterium]|nr:CsbD family protein [Actinomycetaceae bacterium]